MALRIEDYALIGDCQTVALVGNDGSIDWFCAPRFDSGACFAGLLGTPEHGHWQVAPAEPVRAVRRRYREGTLVLETEFETDGGLVAVIDFMPPRSGGSGAAGSASGSSSPVNSAAAPAIIRIVEGRRGVVPMRMDLTIRFDYGSIVPWVQHVPGGIKAVAGPDTVYCRSEVPMHGKDLHTVADFEARQGERVAFELAYAETHESEPAVLIPDQALRYTEDWWQEWSGRSTYDGHWRQAVQRSLITLKAMTYAPTGGVVAAATTSLPEQLGGVRNWDYRFCWLRDATFTLYALMVGGYIDEARAWRQWLLNAVAGTPDKLQIMYGLAGERRLTEHELPWLPGYENSRPVRIGNGAYDQHQLDVYGEVIDSMHAARKLGLVYNADAWRVERAMLRFLESDWHKPDEGIWEVRGPKRHFTQSKVMAWVAMDRAVLAVEEFGLEGEADKWRTIRDEIRRQVLAEGFNRDVNAFTQYYGSRDPDASLLMLPLVGFIPADDPRMIGTVELIQKRLVRDGFVDRYLTEEGVDGLPPGEGAFLLCTFWLADNLALQGRYRDARDVFERLLSLRNDVGLLSEEYDPHTKRLVGNFPQAFSHIGLINTARNLTRAGGPAEERPTS